MTIKSWLGSAALALLAGTFAASANAQQIAIGHLQDLSGGTSDVGTPYGQGVVDTFAWVNKNGGIGGKQLAVDSNDYGYQVPRAIALYKKWSAPDNKVAAIMGWGTADTEALTGFLANDKIPDMSGSYAAALTDPEGTSGKAKPAPYNFFYGPSYSDALRAELTWAAEDWKAKGKPGKPKFVHMGANHPYPNAPKAAGDAADGVIFPLRTSVGWGGDAPGMKTVQEIAKMSDPTGKVYRPVHYVAAVCSSLYMKEAIEWAVKNGGPTGENVAKGFHQKKDWVPAGMEGVCSPSTWTEKDHRGTMKVDLYRARVTGPTDGDLNDLMAKGVIKLEKVKTIELPRKAEWAGW
ncbi:MAG: ABC transporter substrate-binding protein [Bradyrhizobium sp.]|uniref:ABC transporter substrate-binding protein n=1 Tax=Bradyrhizobium sp. TaxID=376 RepID=UPI0028FFEB62|nr:ABC transporter substrate-binding protein [Bradyrhizobium sp.]MDU3131576.1 ABC transporter substrate-binding protein [Bradyrhizobium sp.]